jgi:hypothetical protein
LADRGKRQASGLTSLIIVACATLTGAGYMWHEHAGDTVYTPPRQSFADTAYVVLAYQKPPERAVTAEAPAPISSLKSGTVVKLIGATQHAYRGECPCPYNLDADGRSCGDKNMWSMGKGARSTPLVCYTADITPLLAMQAGLP